MFYVIDCDNDETGFIKVCSDHKISSWGQMPTHEFVSWLEFASADEDITLVSYNPSGYDARVIQKDYVSWIDLYKKARQKLGKNRKYRRWCYSHGYLTNSHNASLSLETVYRYLTGTTYKQKHDALSDAEMLYTIWQLL